MPGPKPKLPQIKRLEGNPGQRRVIDSGIEGVGEVFVPEHLCDDARGCIEVIKQSMPPKVYARLDTFLLAAFAAAWAVHRKAALEISNPGFEWMVEGSAGQLQANPWLKVMRSEAQVLAALGDRLGIGPKARAGLHVPSERPASKFDGLRGRTSTLREPNGLSGTLNS